MYAMLDRYRLLTNDNVCGLTLRRMTYVLPKHDLGPLENGEKAAWHALTLLPSLIHRSGTKSSGSSKYCALRWRARFDTPISV